MCLRRLTEPGFNSWRHNWSLAQPQRRLRGTWRNTDVVLRRTTLGPVDARYLGRQFRYDGPVAYDETRISIDLFDAKSRTPIWHASVSQSVSDLTGPNAVQRINNATAAIFTKCPVGAALPAGARTTT